MSTHVYATNTWHSYSLRSSPPLRYDKKLGYDICEANVDWRCAENDWDDVDSSNPTRKKRRIVAVMDCGCPVKMSNLSPELSSSLAIVRSSIGLNSRTDNNLLYSLLDFQTTLSLEQTRHPCCQRFHLRIWQYLMSDCRPGSRIIRLTVTGFWDKVSLSALSFFPTCCNLFNQSKDDEWSCWALKSSDELLSLVVDQKSHWLSQKMFSMDIRTSVSEALFDSDHTQIFHHSARLSRTFPMVFAFIYSIPFASPYSSLQSRCSWCDSLFGVLHPQWSLTRKIVPQTKEHLKSIISSGSWFNLTTSHLQIPTAGHLFTSA